MTNNQSINSFWDWFCISKTSTFQVLVECTLIGVDVACNDNTMYLSTYRIYDIINAKRDYTTTSEQNRWRFKIGLKDNANCFYFIWQWCISLLVHPFEKLHNSMWLLFHVTCNKLIYTQGRFYRLINVNAFILWCIPLYYATCS